MTNYTFQSCLTCARIDQGLLDELSKLLYYNRQPQLPSKEAILTKGISTAANWWLIQRLSATLPQKNGRALSDRKYPKTTKQRHKRRATARNYYLPRLRAITSRQGFNTVQLRRLRTEWFVQKKGQALQRKGQALQLRRLHMSW